MIEFLFDSDDNTSAFNDVLRTSFTLSSEELQSCRTMGDLETIAWQKVAEHGGMQNRCIGGMAFYALRRGLAATRAPKRFRPSTAITKLRLTPLRIRRAVQRAEGLHLDFRRGFLTAFGGLIGLGSAFVCLSTGLFAAIMLSEDHLRIFGWAAISMLLCALAIWYDPGSFGAVKTVRDAARKLADENFAFFVARGARYSRQKVWQALTRIAAASRNRPGSRYRRPLDPKDIGLETLIHEPERKISWIIR